MQRLCTCRMLYGFDYLYNNVLEIGDQLLCPAYQDQAGGDYDKISNSTFQCFQRKLRQVTLEAKQQRMQNTHEMTWHDMFKQWTICQVDVKSFADIQLLCLLFEINKLSKKLNPEIAKNFCVLSWEIITVLA